MDEFNNIILPSIVRVFREQLAHGGAIPAPKVCARYLQIRVRASPGSSTRRGVIGVHEKAPRGRRVGRHPRGFRSYALQVLPYAARTVERNLSTSLRR